MHNQSSDLELMDGRTVFSRCNKKTKFITCYQRQEIVERHNCQHPEYTQQILEEKDKEDPVDIFDDAESLP